MTNLIAFLDGKKTYILAFLALVTIGLFMGGVIDRELAENLLLAFGFGGVITLRAAVSKTINQ